MLLAWMRPKVLMLMMSVLTFMTMMMILMMILTMIPRMDGTTTDDTDDGGRGHLYTIKVSGFCSWIHGQWSLR